MSFRTFFERNNIMKTIVFAISLFVLCETIAIAREWSDSSGKFKVEGDYVQLIEGQVRIEKPNGQSVTVPLNRLSQPDKDWVERELARRKHRPSNEDSSNAKKRSGISDEPDTNKNPSGKDSPTAKPSSEGKFWYSPGEAEVSNPAIDFSNTQRRKTIFIQGGEKLRIWPAEDAAYAMAKEVAITFHYKFPPNYKQPTSDSPPQGRMYFKTQTAEGAFDVSLFSVVKLDDRNEGTFQMTADFLNALSTYDPVIWIEITPELRSNLIRIKLKPKDYLGENSHSLKGDAAVDSPHASDVAPSDANNAADQNDLQGTWSPTSIELDAPGFSGFGGEAAGKLMKWVVKGDKLAIKGEGTNGGLNYRVDWKSDRLHLFAFDQAKELEFTLDATKTIKWINFKEGKNTLPGIYSLDGNELKICLDLSGKKRPTEFKINKNSTFALFILAK
jgi:uncharacterized protein (TIGR03067 family)